MLDVFIGRQPIFDRNLKVFGYELLYRNSTENLAEYIDGNQATSQVIINSFLEIGLDRIVGKHRALINLTRDFVTGKHPFPYPPSQVILEILEDVKVDREVIEGIQEFSRKGYQIALDDYILDDDRQPLLEYIDLVKIDLPKLTRDQVAAYVETLKPYNIKLLAEKVETQEDYEFCKSIGFDYFQGFFLCKPNIIQANRTPANRLSIMRILAELQDTGADAKELEELITHDVTLSHKVLRSINSAFYTLPRVIESIHQAVVYLGNRAIKQLATLIILSGIDDKPHELMITALMRSKMCEIVAGRLGEKNTDSYSTSGLLSILDAMMDKPMERLLGELPLSDDINNALLYRQGPMGSVLNCVIAYERGKLDDVRSVDLPPMELRECYLEAIAWANTFNQEFKA